jgi:hypothetical protein
MKRVIKFILNGEEVEELTPDSITMIATPSRITPNAITPLFTKKVV